MKNKYIITILIFLSVFSAQSQHVPITSGYMYNGLYINPAYAGAHEALSLDLLARKQWVGIDGAPTTGIFSAHLPLNNESIGLGMLVYQDRIGVTSNSGVYGNYAYRIKSEKGLFSLGLSFGVDMVSRNLNEVVTTTSQDPIFQSTVNAVLPNVSFGGYYQTKKYYIGLSTPFMLSRGFGTDGNYMSYAAQKSNYMLDAGIAIDLNSDFTIKPSFLFKTIPEQYSQIDLNTILQYKNKFGLGMSYRNSRDIIALLFFRAMENLIISYQYDVPLKYDGRVLTPSHEIYIRYNLKKKHKIENPRFF